MVDTEIQTELVKQLDQLPVTGQRKVLDYARSLAQQSLHGMPGRTLLPFAGTIEGDDCRAMIEAIEAGCEQVDSNDW